MLTKELHRCGLRTLQVRQCVYSSETGPLPREEGLPPGLLSDLRLEAASVTFTGQVTAELEGYLAPGHPAELSDPLAFRGRLDRPQRALQKLNGQLSSKLPEFTCPASSKGTDLSNWWLLVSTSCGCL
ncbi:Hypothetical predicted protein [Marmota monax]|uniref:Uncharacterized protein n=1 Tax=Marmota monax TaxID=9995 RepID=A0A5E4B4K7_MARMO|nr:Hypothetical predicted protein [Marmota monax]